MNNITREQNTPRQIQRLGAQRQLYSEAKKIFACHAILSGPIAIALTFVVLKYPETKGIVALWGLLLSVSDIVWLTPFQRHLREKAASIQELFDCEVLELPWPEIKAPKKPDPELVKEQYLNFQKKGVQIPLLENWYSINVSVLPIHIARIACQRSNCWWNAKLRRFYAVTVVFVFLVVSLIVLAVALANKFTIEDFILKVAIPLSPAFILAVRQVLEQIDTAKRLDNLKEHSEKLWKAALNGMKEDEVAMHSRALQDEILENRQKSPFIFDFIYKRLQPIYEQQMNYGIEELVLEAQQKIK